MSDPYTSHNAGKLKLKGVKDSKVSKPKKSKSKGDGSSEKDLHKDNSVVLRQLEDGDAQLAREKHNELAHERVAGASTEKGTAGDDAGEARKTEAERRWDEQRRKRLEDRLRREGVKTHKERVEELNRYLSGLSEHHDMPKIGPG
jgi:protein FAM32A